MTNLVFSLAGDDERFLRSGYREFGNRNIGRFVCRRWRRTFAYVMND